jgi:dTMP kinase
MKGLFLTFEGGEGAGKSSLIKELSQKLNEFGIDTLKTFEPGGSPLGKEIRQWILHGGKECKIGQKAELLLFLADRAQHLEEVILPALEEGKIVLCDRFNDSTIAYQGHGRNLGVNYVENLCNLVCQSLVPNKTFFLRVDPEIGISRARARNPEQGVDRMESLDLDFHRRVLEGFDMLSKRNNERYCTIDASSSQEKVLEEVLRKIKSLF